MIIDKEYIIGEVQIENIRTFLLESAKQLATFKILGDFNYLYNVKKVLRNVYSNFTFGDYLDTHLKQIINLLDGELFKTVFADISLVLTNLANLYKNTDEIQKIKER